MDETQRILDAIRRLVRLLRISDRAAQGRVGLSAAQLFVLHELGRTPAISLGELAAKTRTDQSSVSTVVTRLVTAGLVQRERAEEDGRRLVLTLTRSGKAALKKAPQVAQESLVAVVERFTPAEKQMFAMLFTQLVDQLGANADNIPMLFEDEPRRRKG